MTLVLALVPRMIPSPEGIFVGGVVNSAISQIQALPPDYDVTVLTGVPSLAATRLKNGLAPQRMKIVPIEIDRPLSSYSWLGQYAFKVALESHRLSKQARFDIVHGHSGHPVYAAITFAVGRLLSIPTVHSLYCPIERDPRGSYSLFGWLWIRMLLNRLHLVTGMSRNIVGSLRRIGVQESRIIFLPPVINLDQFSPNLYNKAIVRKILDLSLTRPLVLFVGNLTTTKGVDVLLEAVPLILEAEQSAYFVLTFDLALKDNSNVENQRITEIANRIQADGLATCIRLMGIVNNMAQLLAAVDVVTVPFLSTVGPSDYPLIIIEAMAMGRTVVASRIGGIPEILDHGQNGLLVSPGDPKELAGAIVSLLSNAEYLERLGANALSIVRKSFSNSARQYEHIYRRFTGKGGPHAD